MTANTDHKYEFYQIERTAHSRKVTGFLFWFFGPIFFFMSSIDAGEIRAWTHINGKTIVGTLLEFKDQQAKIKFGDQEVTVKLQDLSEKDQLYLHKIAESKVTDDSANHGKTSAESVMQRYLDFGEERNLADHFQFSAITRNTLTDLIDKALQQNLWVNFGSGSFPRV